MALYEYRATTIRVVDGDTIHARLDLGCDVRLDLTLRLAGIDAPELSTPEGLAAKRALADLLTVPGTGPTISGESGWRPLTVRTIKDRREKYGRYLAWLSYPDSGGATEVNVNLAMVAAGHAVPYEGGAR